MDLLLHLVQDSIRNSAGNVKQDAPRGAAIASFAVVFAAAAAYVAAAPRPDAEARLGATRASAVAPDSVPASDRSQMAAVKIVGASAETGKPCHEQTWPYIEQRCLTPAASDAQRAAADTRPLGIRALLFGAQVPEMQPRSNEIAAVAPAPSETPTTASKPVLSAAATDPTSADQYADIPLPRSRPDISLAELPTGEDDDDAEFFLPPVPLSRAEQRRLEREWRRMERAERRAVEYDGPMPRREFRANYRAERDIRRAVDRFIRHFR